MISKKWSELGHICPIDIERIKEHSREFETQIPNKVTIENLNSSKEAVLNARASLNSMFVCLIQILHDKKILQKKEDKILFAWMIDNFGRYMKRLDDEEYSLIVKFDEPTKESVVGIGRISSYSKILVTSADSIIYESLLRATQEYGGVKETEKVKKEPRTFLYILFQILQVTMAVLGGLTREKIGIPSKKGTVQSFPFSYQALMGEQGQEFIRRGFKEDTGQDVGKISEDLDILQESEEEITLEEGDLEDDEED